MEDRGNHRQSIGKQGEDIACNLLRSMGHTILERNWRSGHLEIDIISFDKDGIILWKSRPAAGTSRHRRRKM